MALAQDLTTIDGLPLHPLVVHAVVVLLPLAAVAAAGIAVRSVWRRRFGWPVLALTLAGVAAVPVATRTGDELKDALGAANPLIERHADLGGQLLPYALAFGVAVVVLVVAGRLADRERAAEAAAEEAPTPPVPTIWRRVAMVTSVLVLASAVAATVQVVRIGHSGSSAVWQGVGTR